MDAYETIKQQAALLLASTKKLEAYIYAALYEDYFRESGEIARKTIELLTSYHDEFAVYPVVGNVFQTLIETSEQYYEKTGEMFEMPLFYANLHFKLTAGFLADHANNPQVASMLMLVVSRVMFSLLDFIEAYDDIDDVDEEDDVTLSDEFDAYYTCMFNIVRKVAENLKLVNPSDPQLEPIMQYLSHQDEWHIEKMSLELSQLKLIVPLLDEYFDKFLPMD